MSNARQIGLATCREVPNLTADDQLVVDRLDARGVRAMPVVWDDPAFDPTPFDFVIIRSAWDFARRRDDFITWARAVPRLLPPAPVLVWNTDKHYLAELEAAGVPIVATQWLEPTRSYDSRGLHTRFPAMGDFVIKPAVSAGGKDSGRYTANDSFARGLAIEHARRLLGQGRTVMVQRYVASVDTAGEAALVYLSGQFAYAVARQAMLQGPDQAVSTIRRPEVMTSHGATGAEIDVANAAMAAATKILAASGAATEPPLLARVDLVDPGSGPEVLELELTVPSLYTSLAPGAADLVAGAITNRLNIF